MRRKGGALFDSIPLTSTILPERRSRDFFSDGTPEPANAPLRGGATLRWGILAPGVIADAWTSTVHANTDQRIVAVASRDASRAAEFASRHGIPTSYGDYEQLVADRDVDIVYIAPPHTEHKRLAVLATTPGKHVLVEKPLAISEADAREIFDAPRAAGVFAIEPLWTRFLPQTTIIRQVFDDGVAGFCSTSTSASTRCGGRGSPSDRRRASRRSAASPRR